MAQCAYSSRCGEGAVNMWASQVAACASQMVQEGIRSHTCLDNSLSTLLAEQHAHDLFKPFFFSLNSTLAWKPFCLIKVTLKPCLPSRSCLILREQPYFFHCSVPGWPQCYPLSRCYPHPHPTQHEWRSLFSHFSLSILKPNYRISSKYEVTCLWKHILIYSHVYVSCPVRWERRNECHARTARQELCGWEGEGHANTNNLQLQLPHWACTTYCAAKQGYRLW